MFMIKKIVKILNYRLNQSVNQNQNQIHKNKNRIVIKH